MKHIKKTYLKSMSTLFICIISLTGYSQKLKIGDPAPKLTPFEWIKGEAVTEFKKGTPYIVEFGATWCGPCHAAIPKLNDIAERYKGKVKVISIFVQEMNHEPLDTPNPKYVENVRQYVQKKEMNYTVAVDDPQKTIEAQWIKAMNKGGGVPQTFVIDANGRVAAHFKGFNARGVENLIKKMLDGRYNIDKLIEAEKEKVQPVAYDRLKPLYVDGNGGDGGDFPFRSMLTKAKGDIVGSYPTYVSSLKWITSDEGVDLYQNSDFDKVKKEVNAKIGRFQGVNIPLIRLYHLAYSDTLDHYMPNRWILTGNFLDTAKYRHKKTAYQTHWPEAILEVTDKSPFEYNRREHKNLWNYVVQVPKEKESARFLQKAIQRDLEIYFGYEVTVETREMPCWYLRAHPGTAKKLATKTPGAKRGSKSISNESIINDTGIVDKSVEMTKYNNWDVRDLMVNLNYSLLTNTEETPGPIIDNTGIKGEIDFQLPKGVLGNCSGNFKDCLKTLEEYLGLYLEKGTKPMKVVVIRDPKEDM